LLHSSFKSSPCFPNVISQNHNHFASGSRDIINLNLTNSSKFSSFLLFPLSVILLPMENQFFMNSGVHFEPAPPPPLPPSSSSVPSWQSLSPAMGIQPTLLNCASDQTQDCFYNPNWEKSTTDHALHFDSSALSSMVSSPAASSNPTSSSNMSNDNFIIRELVGRLGAIGSSDEIPHPLVVASSYINNGSNSPNASCYTTPLSSPPKVKTVQSLVNERLANLGGKSVALNSSVAEFSADPGFAERAAKFSCFGSRSFNGRNVQLGVNSGELAQRSASVVENGGKLSRISSSPLLKTLGSQMGTPENKNSAIQEQEKVEVANSQEESTISEQTPNGEIGMKNCQDMTNSRKRKASSKGKTRETIKVIKKSNFYFVMVYSFCIKFQTMVMFLVLSHFLIFGETELFCEGYHFLNMQSEWCPFQFRVWKSVRIQTQSETSQTRVRETKMDQWRLRKSPKQWKRNRTKATQNLLSHQKITFMWEQEEAKPLTAIV